MRDLVFSFISYCNYKVPDKSNLQEEAHFGSHVERTVHCNEDDVGRCEAADYSARHIRKHRGLNAGAA